MYKESGIWKSLAPYKDIIVFVGAMLAANYFWKFTFTGDESGTEVMWLGIDVTAPFALMARHIASVSAWVIELFRDTVRYIEPYTLRFDTGTGVKIVWGCTGLKQSFIWLVIMLAAAGSWRRKLWFIPLGWVCIYVFNLLRIIIVAFIIEFHPELFELLHSYIFKYMFYFMLFMLWVGWNERWGRDPKDGNSGSRATATAQTVVQD